MRPYRNFFGVESRDNPTHGIVENVKVILDRYHEIVLLMDIMVVYVPNVWGILLSREFVATLGGTLQMDLTDVDIPMDDGTYAHLPNMTMENNHDEYIDLDSETEETHEVVK